MRLYHAYMRPVAVTALMETLLPVAFEALPIIGGILYVLSNRRARHRLRNARLAGALLVELCSTHKFLREVIDSNTRMKKIRQGAKSSSEGGGGFGHYIQSNVYDGLVSSSNIAYFDHDTQENLHSMYVDAKLIGHKISRAKYDDVSGWIIDGDKGWADGVLRGADEAIQAVETFRDRNRYRGRWLPVLKAIHLAYDD